MTQTKIGRPRSEASQEAILNATNELLNEKGAAGLTVEAIARQAKVGKTTIYRWWPTLADIVLELLLNHAAATIKAPELEGLEDNLRHFLRQSMKAINDWGGVHLRFLMAHAQKDEEFRSRFRENFIKQRRKALGEVIASSTRKPVSEKKLNFLLDIIFGAMWYRLLIGHALMDDDFADELARTGAVLAAC